MNGDFVEEIRSRWSAIADAAVREGKLGRYELSNGQVTVDGELRNYASIRFFGLREQEGKPYRGISKIVIEYPVRTVTDETASPEQCQEQSL